jgi:hypothetical protein
MAKNILQYYRLKITAINRRLRIIPRSTRFTVYMLNQILCDKTVDVGKIVGLLIQHQQSQFI